MTTILIKKKDTAGAPASGDLTNAAGGTEIAVNTATRRIYTKDSGGNVVELGTNPSALDAPVVIEGTTTDAALRITQLGTGNALLVEDSSNPDSTPFVIDASGNTVIGSTTAPSIGGAIRPFSVVQTNSNAFAAIGRYTNDTGGSGIVLQKSRGTTVGDVTVVQSGDFLGTLYFAGSDGTSNIFGASISASVDGTPGTNDMPGRLVFSTTADGASTPTERMRIDSAGQVTIGGSPTAGVSVYLRKNITGATTGFGLAQNVQIQSDVTSTANLFNSVFSTAASAFTLTNVNHFVASQSTIGAGSAVTNQFGFLAGNSLTGATNNYGFWGNIASGTGRYNFYAAGTADNYFAGNVLQGYTSPLSFTGPAGSITPTIQAIAAASSLAQGIASTTHVTSANGPNIFLAKSRGASASAPTIVSSGDAAGSIVFNAYDGAAYLPTAYIQALVDGTPGLNDMPGRLMFSTTADGASSPTERMRIDSVGNIGINTAAPAGQALRMTKNITGSISSYAVNIVPTFQSDVTTGGHVFQSVPSTQAAAFTMTALRHFNATQGTIGVGSTVTNQYGFNVSSTLIGATNNYGFYGDIASATGAWNLYMNGTANNYLAGSLGIGTSSLAGNNLYISKNITGAVTAYNLAANGVVQSDVTGAAYGVATYLQTQAAAFTLPTLAHYSAAQGTIGAGSTVTSQFGYRAEASLTGATNNYGFWGNIASGTGRYNIYMAGTADNYFAGNVGIGTSSPASGSGGGLSIGTTSSGKSLHLYASTYAGSGLVNFFGTDGAVKMQMGASGSTSAFVYGSAGVLQLGGNGSEAARIDSSGNLLVGTTTASGLLTVKGAGATSGSYSTYVTNSSGTVVFGTRNDGYIFMPSTYGLTTGNAANFFINSDGSVYRSTSSLKYKTDVQDATHGLTELLTLRSVTYKGKSESDADKTFGGLIAEEIHAAGLTEFVQYAEDGTPDALAYGPMVSLCIKAIQEQQALITTLTERITALEAK